MFKLSSKWNSQVNNLVFGLALWKALASFRHDLAGSSGFSADAHQHQVSFGLSFKQVGLWFIHPLGFGSSPPHSRLCRLADSTSTPSPSIPLVHQLFLVRPLDIFYHDLLFISACADLMLRTQSPWNTRLLLLVLFIDAGLGATHGGNLALRAGRRRQYWPSTSQHRHILTQNHQVAI